MKKITLFFAAITALPAIYGADIPSGSMLMQKTITQPSSRSATYAIPSRPSSSPCKIARNEEALEAPVIYGNLIYRGDWDRYLGGYIPLKLLRQPCP